MKLNNEALIIALANSRMLLKDLAEKSEISPEALRNIRQGKSNPRPSTIGKIAKALNIPVTSLIEENE